MSVDTGKVADRRTLKFENLGQVLTEVDRLAEAQRRGRLRQLGNWTLGQALGHMAVWAEYSYTGAPMKVPFVIRAILRTRKKKFLYSPMRAGVKIPRIEGGTLGTETMETDVAAARLRTALERLEREAPTMPNIIFGKLTHEEWIAINLRHAELHLSFFVAE
jgi:hypothetical protein